MTTPVYHVEVRFSPFPELHPGNPYRWTIRRQVHSHSEDILCGWERTPNETWQSAKKHMDDLEAALKPEPPTPDFNKGWNMAIQQINAAYYLLQTGGFTLEEILDKSNIDIMQIAPLVELYQQIRSQEVKNYAG